MAKCPVETPDAPRPPRPPMLLARCIAGGPLHWWVRTFAGGSWECSIAECESHQLIDIDRDASDAAALAIYDRDMGNKGEK